MDERVRPFLSAVRDEPGDDLPRLVFADWLEENGDADRAEFIRVQVELAGTPPRTPRWHELTARQQRLLAADGNGLNWRTGLAAAARGAGIPAGCRFVRGFPHVTCRSRDLKIADPDRFAWVLELHLTAVAHSKFKQAVAAVRDWPPVLRFHTDAGGALLEWVAESVQAEAVRELYLWNGRVGDRAVEALAASPHVGRLRTLDLAFNRVTDRGAAALAASGLTGLRSLDLSHNPLTAAGARALIESPTLPRDVRVRGRPAEPWPDDVREAFRARFGREAC